LSVKQTGIVAHDNACNLAEMQRQISVAAAATQSAVTAAELVYHRACVASSRSNNGSADIAIHNQALKALGVNS